MIERSRPTFQHVTGVSEPAMTPDPNGGWVSYADHLALLGELADELECDAVAAEHDKQMGNGGELERGKDPDTLNAAAALLRKHLEEAK